MTNGLHNDAVDDNPDDFFAENLLVTARLSGRYKLWPPVGISSLARCTPY